MGQLELPKKYKNIALVNPGGYFFLNHRMQYYFLGISVVICLLQAVLITASVYQGFGYEYVLGSVVFLHCFFYFHHYKASRREALYLVDPASDYFSFILFFQMIPLIIAGTIMVNGDAFVQSNQDVIAALLQPEMRQLFSIPNVFSLTDEHGLIHVYTIVLAIISTTTSLIMVLPIIRSLCLGLSFQYEKNSWDTKDRLNTKDRVSLSFMAVMIWVLFILAYFFNWFSSYGYLPDFSGSPLYSPSLVEAREFVEKGGASFYAHIPRWEFYLWCSFPFMVPLCVCGLVVWFRKMFLKLGVKHE